mgnify:CR=1 FL=1
MYNILYYGLCVTALSTTGVGLLYMMDADMANSIMSSVSWNFVKIYHYAKQKYDKNCSYNLVKSVKKPTEAEHIYFIGYTHNNNNSFKTKELSNEYIYDNSFDIMFLKYKNKYKRLLSKDEINIFKGYDNNTLDKVFDIENKIKILLQVQIEYSDVKLDIHNDLIHFYMDDNIILDEDFLNWYVYVFYNTIMNREKYKLSIIDGDVNIFRLKNSESLCVEKEDDTYNYKIKKNII